MVRFVTWALAVTVAASAAALGAGPGSGDAKHGEAVFQQCQFCHNANKNGGNGLGPNLFGVVGRKAASLPNFYYSDALKKSHIVWTETMLRQWVAGPAKVVPGTRMAFAGLSDRKDIADVVAFLKTRK